MSEQDRKLARELGRRIAEMKMFWEDPRGWSLIELQLDVLLFRASGYSQEELWHWVDLLRWREVALFKRGLLGRPMSALVDKLPLELPPPSLEEVQVGDTPLDLAFEAVRSKSRKSIDKLRKAQ